MINQKKMQGVFFLLFLAFFLESKGQVVPSDSMLDKAAYRIKRVKLVSRKNTAHGYADTNLVVHMEKAYSYSADKIVKIEYNYLDSSDSKYKIKLDRCCNHRDSLVYKGIDSVFVFQKYDSSGISIVNSVRSIKISSLRLVIKQIKEKRRFDFSIQNYEFYCRNGKIRKVKSVREVMGLMLDDNQLPFFKSLKYRLYHDDMKLYKITKLDTKYSYNRNGNVVLKHYQSGRKHWLSNIVWLSKNVLSTCPDHVCDSYAFNEEGYLVYKEHFTDMLGPSDCKYEYEKGNGNYFDLEYDLISLLHVAPIIY